MQKSWLLENIALLFSSVNAVGFFRCLCFSFALKRILIFVAVADCV